MELDKFISLIENLCQVSAVDPRIIERVPPKEHRTRLNNPLVEKNPFGKKTKKFTSIRKIINICYLFMYLVYK